jgi:hypothetical protein
LDPDRRFAQFVLTVMRGRLIILLVVVAGLVAGAILAVTVGNQRLTAFVESEAFRKELAKQTSKGLHFQGQYETIRRTGLLTAQAEGFTGKDGVKAIKAISTGEVAAKFNPWGIFQRRWQLDYIRIPSGKAEIQTYEPKPENKPPKPWYAIFLPDRVYLKEVVCESTDVTWQLRGRRAGFFQTRLLITPYGRDFEYRASGGVMKTGMVPELALRQTHLVITKELLTLHELELAPSLKSDGRIRVKGQAGMRDDKSVSAEVNFSGIPVDPWVPKAWAGLFQGVASGDVVWQGSDTTMESSSGGGAFRIEGGRVAGAPFLEEAAAVTGKPVEEIKLSRFSLEFEWKYPRVQIKQIDIEADGVFRLQGAVVIDGGRLGGTLQFGATPKYLEWLPKAERIFARERDGYLWTAVNLAGTLEEPKEDLSPRVAELLKKSPGAAIGIFIRRIGEWFENLGEN